MHDLEHFGAGMLEDLHDMLQKDPDAQVVANCMSVLLEVRAMPNLTTCRHPAAVGHCRSKPSADCMHKRDLVKS